MTHELDLTRAVDRQALRYLARIMRAAGDERLAKVQGTIAAMPRPADLLKTAEKYERKT